jgi:hypothetical protein
MGSDRRHQLVVAFGDGDLGPPAERTWQQTGVCITAFLSSRRDSAIDHLDRISRHRNNGLYNATPGWDYTTGMGSFDVSLINKLIQ